MRHLSAIQTNACCRHVHHHLLDHSLHRDIPIWQSSSHRCLVLWSKRVHRVRPEYVCLHTALATLSMTNSRLRVDVKYLKTYQQLAIYFFPIVTNLAVIHPVVIFVRLRCFEARFKQVGTYIPGVTMAFLVLILVRSIVATSPVGRRWRGVSWTELRAH